jgi:multidrug resistance efflux pump
MAQHPLEVVPRLRQDLEATAPPAALGAEVIRVGPVDSANRVALHGFEFSIARMLDGKRTLRDVVVNCEKLGLPIDPDALEGFIRQLKCYGFLARGHDAPQRGRDPWLPTVRAMFRRALYAARMGNVREARDDLKQLLTVAPTTPEARDLLNALDDPAPADTFQALVHEAQESWTEELRVPRFEGLRSFRPLLGLAVGVGVFAAAALIPMPRIVPTSAELTPVAEVPVVSGHEGTIDDVRIHEGDYVELGAVLFTWNSDDLELRLSEARERLEAVRGPLYDTLRNLPGAGPAWARLQRAEAELSRARASLLTEQREGAVGELTLTPTGTEHRFDVAEAETNAARSALDALTPPDTAEGMALGAVTLEIASLEEQLREREVRAQTAGIVSHLYARPGQQVLDGEKLAQLDDLRRLKVAAVLTPQQAAAVHEGEPITVHLGAEHLASTVTAVSNDGLTTEIANPSGALKVGPVTLDLELPSRSLIERLRGL